VTHSEGHVQGQGRYGFGTGMPEDVFGAFSNVAPSVRPEYNEEQFRAAMGFVPVAGTAYNWNQMGPWGRAGSVAMDALDVLTAGSGKALTTPLKALSKWINPAQMRFLRFGEVPTTGGYDRALGQLPGLPEASRSNLAFPKGTNEGAIYLGQAAGKQEPGVSVYQSLLDPNTGKYVLKDAPSSYTMGPENLMNPHGDWRFGGAGRGFPYKVNPMVTQDSLINTMAEQYNKRQVLGKFDRATGEMPYKGRREDWPFYRTGQPYEVSGNPMTALGSDLEPQLYPRSIPLPTGQTYVSPTQIVRQGAPSTTLLGETLSNVPSVSFDKYDEFGRPILNSWQKLIQQASRARPGSTIPYTTTGRSGLDWNESDFAWNTPGLFGGVAPQRPYQTPFNLEEQYQQQAGRRGGWSPGG
jgi:hypothetical protein